MSRGAYLAAAIVVWPLAAVVDVAVGAPGDGLALAAALGVGAGAGLLVGLTWELLLAGLARVREEVAWTAWLVASVAAAALLAHAVGAFDKLGGHHGDLALAILGASVAGGLAFGGALAAQQPSAEFPRGRLGAASTRIRLLAVAALLIAAVAFAWVDRTRFVGVYDAAHGALRLATLASATMALAVLLPVGRALWRPALLAYGAVALAAWAASFAWLADPAAPVNAALVERPMSRLALRGLRTLGDPDGDGYGAFLGGGDCAPLDPGVHPAAREVPGNGVDDNCLWGDAPAPEPHAAPRDLPRAEEAGEAPASVVLVTIDTLRPDRMSLYGHGRETTPNLDRWARDALVFDRAYTSGGWTSLAIPSLMRGVYPRRIRWTRYWETNALRLFRKPDAADLAPGEEVIRAYALPAPDARPPLAERLRRHGLATAAAVHDAYSEMLSPEVGTARGFDAFVSGSDLPPTYRPDFEGDRVSVVGMGDYATVSAAIAMLRGRRGDAPFFLWLHLFTPHGPDVEMPDVPRWGDAPLDRYDAMVRFADLQVGRLLDALEPVSRRRPVFTVVASDHGEAFFGRDRLHGTRVHEDEIRIPLLVRGPGVVPGRSDALVGLADLAPTLLSAVGAPVPADMDGADLGSILAGAQPPAARILLTDTWRFDAHGALETDLVAAFDGITKLVWDRVDHVFRLEPQTEEPADPAARAPLEAALRDYIEGSGGAVRLRE